MSAHHRLSWGAEALRQQLASLLPGLAVEVLASIDSTNTALLARARRSADDGSDTAWRQRAVQPCLLVAEQQTQGRGRQGKAWQSSAGASLTFSLALPLAPADWSGLSLAVGLALAEALDPPRPGQVARLGIKWPNDLLLRDAPADCIDADQAVIGRKLGGILIETVQVGDQRLAVVGVGLNLSPQQLPPDAPALSWGQACLREMQPDLTAPAALARVAAPLLLGLLAFERHGFAPLRERFAARDLLAGQAVTTTLPGVPGGMADGVDDSGTLWLRLPAGPDGRGERRLAVSSGEISLRANAPRPAPAATGQKAGPC